ncbi:hypothetical protein [Bacillus marinisedimentorum]|uniref:hypothetical protein n=1 Tax=Bacillus marinisedimentorum TaxID=1821260 RepID=UPI000872349E|nr:hypothetical protein [Bacillus marinisedimentorum]
MTRNVKTTIGIAIIFAAVAVIYMFYFAPPAPLPDEAQLLEKMDETFPAGHATEILDTLQLDSGYVFVPFISSGDDYGASYWEWKLHDWKPVRIDTTGEPQIWTPEPGDDSSSYAVWNFHPKDKISKASFYLLRDNSYSISPRSEIYIPKVQLETAADVSAKSYGIMEMPESWNSLLDPSKDIQEARYPNTYLNFGFSEQTMRTGAILYDSEGNQAFPDHSVNGKGYSNGNIMLEYMHFLNEEELLSNE